jgi:phage-related protein
VGKAREVTSKRVQWEGETQTLRGVCHWQGRFEQHYKIEAGRVESREKGKLG